MRGCDGLGKCEGEGREEGGSETAVWGRGRGAKGGLVVEELWAGWRGLDLHGEGMPMWKAEEVGRLGRETEMWRGDVGGGAMGACCWVGRDKGREVLREMIEGGQMSSRGVGRMTKEVREGS